MLMDQGSEFEAIVPQTFWALGSLYQPQTCPFEFLNVGFAGIYPMGIGLNRLQVAVSFLTLVSKVTLGLF